MKENRQRTLLLLWAILALALALVSTVLCFLSVYVPGVFRFPHPAEPALVRVSPAPTAEPTPEPTPEPTWQERFAEHFADRVVQGETTYRSPTLSVTLQAFENTEAHPELSYYVADIYLTDIRQLCAAFALEGEDYSSARRILRHAGGVLGTNGDTLINQTWGFVARNGEVYSTVEPLYDVCVLYTDGRMETFPPFSYSGQALADTGTLWQVWQFGPLLLDAEGRPLSEFNTPEGLRSPHPRTAIGYYEPGHYCLVVVDGRNPPHSDGADIATLAQLMAELGCRAAYNLDGGAMSLMVYNNQYVNTPVGDHLVSDMVIVRELTEEERSSLP